MLTVDGVTLTVGMPSYWNDLSLDAKLDNVAVYDYALTAAVLAFFFLRARKKKK